jgi:hypothetical protein
MRRTKTIVAVAIAVALAITGAASLAQPASRASAKAAAADDEQQQLQALYEKAKAEGGKLTVYVGGDAPGQWDFIAKAFTAQFPDVQVHFVTDLSKYHDARQPRPRCGRRDPADHPGLRPVEAAGRSAAVQADWLG